MFTYYSSTYFIATFTVLVYGLLTAGRRNIMNKSLQMSMFLKLNHSVLKQSGFIS